MAINGTRNVICHGDCFPLATHPCSLLVNLWSLAKDSRELTGYLVVQEGLVSRLLT